MPETQVVLHLSHLTAKTVQKGTWGPIIIFSIPSVSLSKFQVYEEVLSARDRSLKDNLNVTVIISWFTGAAWKEGTESC